MKCHACDTEYQVQEHILNKHLLPERDYYSWEVASPAFCPFCGKRVVDRRRKSNKSTTERIRDREKFLEEWDSLVEKASNKGVSP